MISRLQRPPTSSSAEVYDLHAGASGISRDEFSARMADRTLRRWLPAVAEIFGVATFVASDRAAAMTGAIANLSGGMIADWP